MLNIAICENDRTDREELERRCRQISRQESVECRILLFSSGEEVLACTETIDLLILDIELSGMSGIEVKNKLQQANQKTMVIFVTAYDEMMQPAFGLQVFGFVQKRYLEEQLSEMLPRALQILQDYVMVDGIDSRRIVCIKAEHVYSRLLLEDGSEELMRRPLSYFEKMLVPTGFIRIHKSYLVNARHITGWGSGEVETADGKYPVAVRLRTSAKRQYDQYCEAHAKYCG